MKKILIVLLVALSVFALVSCDHEITGSTSNAIPCTKKDDVAYRHFYVLDGVEGVFCKYDSTKDAFYITSGSTKTAANYNIQSPKAGSWYYFDLSESDLDNSSSCVPYLCADIHEFDLITFIIDGSEYTAVKGMRWGQFVVSEYNTAGLTIDNSDDLRLGTKYIGHVATSCESNASAITENCSYKTKNSQYAW